jgi:two-component system CitB family sensor kinase
VALRVSDATSLEATVVDPRDLVTVLGNLVDNALDAVGAAAEPYLEIELRAERSGTVVLRVSDNGPGVPPEMRHRIFTEGWTTKSSDGRPHGRGIGLALVRRLAERHGGTARVTARAGGGSVFTVVLPEALAPEEAAADTGHGTPPGARPLAAFGERR